jgi:hypothetical protein
MKILNLLNRKFWDKILEDKILEANQQNIAIEGVVRFRSRYSAALVLQEKHSPLNTPISTDSEHLNCTFRALCQKPS